MHPTGFLIRRHITAPGNDDNVEARKTYWFHTESAKTIAHPPDLRWQGNLRVGDLFQHHYEDKQRCQLWLWVDDEGGRWKPVYVGFPRADGRILSLTPKHGDPSWVSLAWFMRRSESTNNLHESHSQSYSLLKIVRSPGSHALYSVALRATPASSTAATFRFPF